VTGEDIHLPLRHSRSGSEFSNLSTPSLPAVSQTYHEPLSTFELDAIDWSALGLLDEKVKPSVLPDDTFMDFDFAENQNEIMNAQMQMALGLGSLAGTQDVDQLPTATAPAVHESYLVQTKLAGCPPATAQLSTLQPMDTSKDLEVPKVTPCGSDHGSTALHLAAQQGYVQIAQLLLDTAADVNAINSDGDSTLHIAVVAKNHAMVSLLLKYGADFNARNARQESVLHLAVETGDLGVVGLLLSRAVDLESQDATGQTALHRAAAKGLQEVMLLLMCKGANSAANVGLAL
jgi:hypothetical protein